MPSHVPLAPFGDDPRLTEAVLDTVACLIIATDRDGRIVLFNRACESLTGYRADEVLGHDAAALFLPADERAGVEAALSRLPRSGPVTHRNHWKTRDGSQRMIEWRNTAMVDASGDLTHIIGTGIDVTARESAERARESAELELTRLALEDPLTGLPNRTLAHAYLNELLASGDPVSVVSCGLDRFKRINDSLGAALADRLVCAVTSQLNAHLRAGERLARSRGDEFFVIAPGSADDLVERLHRSLNEPVVVDEHSLVVTATLGVATSPEAGHSADDLLHSAESALHAAKRHQVPQLRFDAAMHAEETARFAREVGLREALDEGTGLTVWFQPVVRTADGEVVSVEALLRWLRSDGSMMLPGEFLQEVRTAGLAGRLARLTIDLVFDHAARWQQRLGPDRPFRVALNLAPRQVLDVRVIDHLRARVEVGDVDPRLIVVELTEEAFEDVPERTIAVLTELRKAGLAIAVDDFGTGYSALDRLQRFPADYVKIDKSFTSAVDRDHRSYTLVGAIVEASHALGALAIAEGVETTAQLIALRSLGIDAVQGFLFGEAAPEEEVDLSPRSMPA